MMLPDQNKPTTFNWIKVSLVYTSNKNRNPLIMDYMYKLFEDDSISDLVTYCKESLNEIIDNATILNVTHWIYK
jgi:hypothetical protein